MRGQAVSGFVRRRCIRFAAFAIAAQLCAVAAAQTGHSTQALGRGHEVEPVVLGWPEFEPVSRKMQRKLEIAEQRLVPERRVSATRFARTAYQRLRGTGLTHGNIAGSRTPGNLTTETGLVGWGTRIRT